MNWLFVLGVWRESILKQENRLLMILFGQDVRWVFLRVDFRTSKLDTCPWVGWFLEGERNEIEWRGLWATQVGILSAFLLFPIVDIWFGVRTLIKLLNDSQDPVVLAVAVHDLGQYIKHYKQGKKCVLFSSPLPHFPPVLSLSFRVITDLGAKTRAMELMGHEDPDVRYRALLSVQQLVSQPWVTT